MPKGAFRNASQFQGYDSTRLMRYNHLSKGVGESEFGSPLATNSGGVKIAGQKTLQQIIDQDIVDMHNVSRHKFHGNMGVEIDGSFQYVNAPHQQDELHPRDSKAAVDSISKGDGPLRTQSLFNLNHVSSLNVNPSTAAKKNKKDQLESWTKSSIVE